MLIFIVFLIASMFFVIINIRNIKEIEKEASDEKYDKIISALPDNEKVCKEMQQIINKQCEIQLDENTKSSAYIFFLNKIILSNNEMSKNSFSRILFIAHECIHSIQDKKFHIANFILKNTLNLFTLTLIILLFMKKISSEILLIYFLIAFISFCVNMILEADAIYRSLLLSKDYLEKHNKEEVSKKYEEMISKTINAIYFKYASFSIYIICIMSISFIL